MIRRLTRLKLAAWSGLAGWLAGYLASLPGEVWIGLRDSRGDSPLMVQSLMMGLAVWAVWTGVLAAGAWLVAAVPCVLVLAPATLLRLRRRVLMGTAMTAACLAMGKMWAYRDTAASTPGLKFILLLPYGSFAVVYAVVTAWLYLRLAQSQLAASS